jgi:ribosomal protein S18 acetylase RimI-like enzyme
MMYEVPARSNPCKKKALKGEKRYYYVLFLGTSKEGRGQGLCSAIVKQYQEIARKEKLPIYMEAGTEYAWGLYKSLGFITVDEMITGKGKAAADGTQLKGGPGFKGWSMIWRPE